MSVTLEPVQTEEPVELVEPVEEAVVEEPIPEVEEVVPEVQEEAIQPETTVEGPRQHQRKKWRRQQTSSANKGSQNETTLRK